MGHRDRHLVHPYDYLQIVEDRTARSVSVPVTLSASVALLVEE